MDIELIKEKISIKYPSFAIIIDNTNFIKEEEIKTAATDGNNIYYSNEFMDSLSDNDQMFIIAHEICHIAYNHIFRQKDKDINIWNIATDAVVNAQLERDGLTLPKGAIKIENAINYDAEELYEKLLKEKKNTDSSKEGSDHSKWEEANRKNDSQSKDNNEKEKQIERLTQLGEKASYQENKIERIKQLQELKEALVNMSHGYGDKAGEEERIIKSIGVSKPIIDWRMLLKEAIKYDIDWSYENAEIEEGVVTAYLEEIPRPEAEIILDTSGSIDEVLLRNFLRECKNILQVSHIKVGCFDTEFYGFQEIRTEEDIDEMKFMGGGGTDFDVAVSSFTSRVENKILFTDGEAPMPNKKMDIIWIVFGDEKIKPIGGKVIYIDENLLREVEEKEYYKVKIRR